MTKLIDADAFWASVVQSRKETIIDDDVKISMGEFVELLDNAPTVFSCNACKNMGNEQECVDCHDYSNYVHYEERPRGKWIKKQERNGSFVGGGVFSYICPFCGAKELRPYQYCHCGAELIGSEKQNGDRQ